MMFESSWGTDLTNLIENLGYYRSFHLVTWIIAIGMMYIVGIVIWSRSKKSGVITSQARFLQSFALLFFLMGITRVLFVFGYFYDSYFEILKTIAYAFAALSLLPIIITIEKWSLPQTHKIFSIIALVLCVVGFYFVFEPTQSEISRTIQQVTIPVLFVVFVILYVWVIKLSTGAVRTKAILALIGAFIFGLGVILDSEQLVLSIPAIMYLSPLLLVFSMIILGISQKAD